MLQNYGGYINFKKRFDPDCSNAFTIDDFTTNCRLYKVWQFTEKTTPCTHLLKPENKEEGWNVRARGRGINLGDILAPF